MNLRALLFGIFAATTALAEDTPRAIQVAEPPVRLDLDLAEKVTSSSQQFRITGGQPADRSAVSILLEQTKEELLRLTEERDEWKIPVDFALFGKPGDLMPLRTVATDIRVSEAGYVLRISAHLCRGIEQERLKYATTAALIYERALRGQSPQAASTVFSVAPWLVEGLREATAWRLNQCDRRLYEALFKSGGLFKTDDLFALTEPKFEEMDAAQRAAFRVSSGSLVMALLEQPQGKDGFRKFLTEVAAYQGELPALLRNHFPELNLSETSLSKWWALQLANIGGQNLLTDVMNVSRTETALNESLRLHFLTPDGIPLQKDLSAWPELAALKEPERFAATQPAQDALVRLSYRCFPSYRPILKEYQLALSAMAKNQTADTAAQLAALAERRQTMNAKADRARDYLDWFEITRARETSGAFDDYLRLKDRLKANPKRRSDRLSEYLDRMDARYHREGDAKPPTSPANDFGSLPELPPIPLPQ